MDEAKRQAIDRLQAVRNRYAQLAPGARAAAIDALLREARSHKMWLDRPVDDALLRDLYDLMKWGPTSSNSNPARIVFARTAEGKARILPALDAGNVAKVRAAPVTAVIAYDLQFHERLPELFPAADHASHFRDHPEAAEPYALRNSTLQGAWLIIAARAMGLDVGPMSGFDNARLDERLFAGTSIRSNFILNLGYGDPAAVPGRLPRLAFEDACTLI